MALLSALKQLQGPIYDVHFTAFRKDRQIAEEWCAGDWRQLYELGQQALQEKAAGLGKRLRAMTQAEVQSRQTRNVEVRQVISLKLGTCFANAKCSLAQHLPKLHCHAFACLYMLEFPLTNCCCWIY